MKLYLSEGTTAYRKRTLVLAKLSADLYGIFPAGESLVSDIPAGDVKVVNLFLQCTFLHIH
jgi:hypothetical protein